MKKIYLLWLACLAFFLLGCRHDQWLESENYSNPNAFHLKKKIVALDKARHRDIISPVLMKVQMELANSSSHILGRSSADSLSLDLENIYLYRKRSQLSYLHFPYYQRRSVG